jgi:ribosomal protein L21E
MQEGDRVKIIRKPASHATGTGSMPCTCKGKTGTMIGYHGHTIFVRLDKGGRVGVPANDLMLLPSIGDTRG